MGLYEIDGLLFRKILENGLNNIRNHEKIINDMNVFPVPDGDTGTNMRLTVENGFVNSKENSNLGLYLKELSRGMLFGARGNSGVILSQIFNGFSKSLLDKEKATSKELGNAFIEGYKSAYEAVARPVEGTLLTVARQGTERFMKLINDDTTIEEFFEEYISKMKNSLDHTPELLPVLKEAGVKDSGGAGYIVIIEGMYKYLINEIISCTEDVVVEKEIDTSFFDENSEFTYGYCNEFVLQLMNNKFNVDEFDLNKFKLELGEIGESIVAIQDGTRIKVHVHTLYPYQVLEYCQKYGEFVRLKIENMCIQHNETTIDERRKMKTDLAIIAVGNGDGIKKTFLSYKNVYYINGGKTMNASTNDFLQALEDVEADKYIILPNNKNIIPSAIQAKELSGKDNVVVLNTTSIVQGLNAMMFDETDSNNLDSRLESIIDGMNMISTVSVSIASRDSKVNGIECKKDEYITVVDDKVIKSSKNEIDAIIEGIKNVPDLEDKEIGIIFVGKNFGMSNDELNDILANEFDSLYFEFIEGGQEIYDIIVGVR